MNLNKHSSNIASQHAILSPSNPAWVNYEIDKLDRVFHNLMAAKRGTDLHDLAQRMIRLQVRLPDTTETLNAYVNDCIGHRLTPEQTLFYSENCFGTADACGFRNNTFRVFDLKTGVTEAKMTQLKVYAVLFTLEYDFKINEIEYELRIYQNDAVRIEVPEYDELFHIRDKIVTFDRRLKALREEVPF